MKMKKVMIAVIVVMILVVSGIVWAVVSGQPVSTPAAPEGYSNAGTYKDAAGKVYTKYTLALSTLYIDSDNQAFNEAGNFIGTYQGSQFTPVASGSTVQPISVSSLTSTSTSPPASGGGDGSPAGGAGVTAGAGGTGSGSGTAATASTPSQTLENAGYKLQGDTYVNSQGVQIPKSWLPKDSSSMTVNTDGTVSIIVGDQQTATFSSSNPGKVTLTSLGASATMDIDDVDIMGGPSQFQSRSGDTVTFYGGSITDTTSGKTYSFNNGPTVNVDNDQKIYRSSDGSKTGLYDNGKLLFSYDSNLIQNIDGTKDNPVVTFDTSKTKGNIQSITYTGKTKVTVKSSDGSTANVDKGFLDSFGISGTEITTGSGGAYQLQWTSSDGSSMLTAGTSNGKDYTIRYRGASDAQTCTLTGLTKDQASTLLSAGDKSTIWGGGSDHINYKSKDGKEYAIWLTKDGSYKLVTDGVELTTKDPNEASYIGQLLNEGAKMESTADGGTKVTLPGEGGTITYDKNGNVIDDTTQRGKQQEAEWLAANQKMMDRLDRQTKSALSSWINDFLESVFAPFLSGFEQGIKDYCMAKAGASNPESSGPESPTEEPPEETNTTTPENTTTPISAVNCGESTDTVVTGSLSDPTETTTGFGNKTAYESTYYYQITACKKNITYSVYLSGEGKTENIKEGSLAWDKITEGTATRKSYTKWKQVCIKVSDTSVGESGLTCFPELSETTELQASGVKLLSDGTYSYNYSYYIYAGKSITYEIYLQGTSKLSMKTGSLTWGDELLVENEGTTSATDYSYICVDTSDATLNAECGTFDFTDENDPPVLATIPALKATEGQNFTYKVNATDPENDALTFYTDSPLFTIEESTGQISFTPDNSMVGEWNFSIGVTDGELIAVQNVTLSVSNVNDPPQLLLPNTTQTMSPGQQISFDLDDYLYDPDNSNDELHCLYSGGSTTFTLTYDQLTKTVTLSASSSWTGPTRIRFECCDPSSACAVGQFDMSKA